MPVADGLTYVKTFMHALAERGYRPGVYGFRQASLAFRLDCPGLFVWNVNLAAQAGAWGVAANGTLVLDTARPVGVAPDVDALMRQHLFGDRLPAIVGNPVVADAGRPAFLPDLDVSVVNDPAFPERSPIAPQIRFGGAAVALVDAQFLAVHAVRRGASRRSTWRAGHTDPSEVIGGPASGNALNPFVAPVALRLPASGPGPFTEWLLAFGSEMDGDPGAQELWALRRQGSFPWQLTALPTAGLALDPLPGLAAAARSDGTLEVFAADDTGQLAGASFTERRGWSSLALLPVAEVLRRTQGLAAVGRGAGGLDLFWVSLQGALRTSSSPAPGSWNAAATVTLAGVPPAPADTVDVHRLSRLAAVSSAQDRLDVFFVGAAAGTTNWHLCVVSFRQATGWGAPVLIGLGFRRGRNRATLPSCRLRSRRHPRGRLRRRPRWRSPPDHPRPSNRYLRRPHPRNRRAPKRNRIQSRGL